jgi:hypothetical protein
MKMMNDGGKLRGKALYRQLYHEQREWMAERGTDEKGYIAYYCGKFRRSKGYAKAVYEADLEELDRICDLLGPYGFN